MHRVALMVTAFLSGAILMALELVGSRLLAPYFGGSIFVWGSLIGVFLAALSTGYYLGGRLVDRWPSARLLGALLLAAGFYVLLLPRYGAAICDFISLRDYGARAGPLVSCIVLFFLPGALMGVTSPFVVRLSAYAVEVVGRTAGAVYAASTIGSIAGTIGTAFYLIPSVGTRTALYLLAGGLVVTALIAAAKRGPRLTTAIAAALLPLLLASGASAKERVLLERDSPYHHLYVTEDETYRWLRADNVWHTRMTLRDRHGPGLTYTDYADLAFLFNPKIRKVLVIGLGGGTIPKRFVRDYPQVSVTAVEIDPDVIKIAARYFDVHAGPRLTIRESDGRMFLRRTTTKWDLIVLDAYYADSVPFFLATREFFDLARSRLNPGGVLVNNVVGMPSGPRSSFFRSVYRTMRLTFPQIHAFQVPDGGQRWRNIEVFGMNSEDPVTMATLRMRAGSKDAALARRLDTYLGPDIAVDDVPTLSDDYAPVDALIHLW
jgi:spermidine synthase